jgi:predicted DNA-binding transcriptional regulator AlpA
MSEKTKASRSARQSKTLSAGQVLALTGLSRAALWYKRRAGEFPQPVDPTRKPLAWDSAQVRAWKQEKKEKRR